MELWLLLVLLGIITYFIVKRSVANITTTPIWMLWLVLMMPALVWSAWTVVQGEKTPMPMALAIGPFILCPLLYWWLIQKGRKVDSSPAKATDMASPLTLLEKGETDSTKQRPITKEEETELRDCFPWSVYYLQNLEYRPQAVLCRGKLRTNPETAYQTVKKNVERKFGDRFFLVFQQGNNDEPFFALVPNPQATPEGRQNTEQLIKPGLATGLLVATLFTTTLIGAEIAGVSAEQVKTNPNVLLQGLPYALALMFILTIHELGHYLTAVSYKIRTTLPYFIPVPFFLPGTFGAFIQMRSPIPNRKALFDVGISGPLSGFIVTVPLLIWGLTLSRVVPISDQSGLFNFESLNPRFSLLITVLSKAVLGSALTTNTAIHLHPIAVAGYIGVVVTALNLMPVGQLDGGHIVHAMFGQKTGAAIGQIARLLMLVLALVQPELLLWAVILLFMPVKDEPALNDVSELDNWRDFWGLLALVLLVSIVLPPPVTITQWLNL